MLKEETQKRLERTGLKEETFIKALREVFPHGHPNFLEESIKEMELHSLKNHDYASGGSALGNFERGAAILAMYPGLNLGDKRVFALVLALKQIDAVLWGLAQNITHKVEGLNSRLDDIAVYAKIVKCMNNDLVKLTSPSDVARSLFAKEALPYTSSGTGGSMDKRLGGYPPSVCGGGHR